MDDLAKIKLPTVVMHHIEVAAGIGRISLDGEVDGKLVACVFMADEIPEKVKTPERLYAFYQQKLKEASK